MSNSTALVPEVVGGVASLVKAEIDMQIATARAYPRDPAGAIERAKKMATMTRDIAESCTYSLPRDGKTISGPSVRLAEIMFSNWGNLRGGTRVLDIDKRYVTVQGVVHDLESNVAYSAEVIRQIVTKSGKRYSDAMIVTTSQAAMAIAFRNAMFKAIPTAIVAEVYAAAQQKALGGGDAKALPVRAAEVVSRLQKSFGISEKSILDTMQVDSVDRLKPKDVEALIGYGTAIKDGEATAEEIFGIGDAKRIAREEEGDEGDDIDLDGGEVIE